MSSDKKDTVKEPVAKVKPSQPQPKLQLNVRADTMPSEVISQVISYVRQGMANDPQRTTDHLMVLNFILGKTVMLENKFKQ